MLPPAKPGNNGCAVVGDPPPTVMVADRSVSIGSIGQNSRELPSAEATGKRLRQRRVEIGLSARELARRTSVSASLISQIERGISSPSVATLYAIVSALGLSMDELFELEGATPASRSPSRLPPDPVVRADERETLRLGSGVRWERLTRYHVPHTEFNLLVYEPGGASSEEGTLVRHAGFEYGLVLSGRLSVQLRFEFHELGPGDSISFESWQPHRLATVGSEPAHAVWVVVDRSGPDSTTSASLTWDYDLGPENAGRGNQD